MSFIGSRGDLCMAANPLLLSRAGSHVSDNETGNRVWLLFRESPVSEGFGHGIFYAFQS